MDLLVFLIGAALLAGAVRFWRPELRWRTAAAFVLLVAAFFALPLLSLAYGVPTDIAYLWRPWSETIERGAAQPPQNGLLVDVTLQLLPWRQLVRERLLAGQAPLWSHEMGTGQPLLGNAQSAPFAPFHLLALPLPPLRAMTVAVAWQFLLALLLTYSLAAALGAAPSGAVFAAVAYAFSTFSICWAYYPLGMAAAWVPGVLLGLWLLRRGERGGLSGLVACGAGLALSGHPETLAHAALAGAAVTVILLLAGGGVGRWRFAGKLAAAAVVTGCLSAPALLPALAALPDSARREAAARNPGAVRQPPFSAASARLLVDPLSLGSPRDANWDGPLNFNELASGYAGLLALALAIAGALALRGRPLAIMAGGLAALAAALRLPLAFNLVAAIPGLEHAVHGRLRLLWVLALALAAGLAVEALPRRRGPRITAAVLVALAAAALACSPPPPALWQRAWWLVALAGAAAALAALLVPRLRPWFPLLALLGLGLDLILLGRHYLPLVPSRFDLSPPAAVAFLAAEQRRSPEPFRVLGEEDDLAPNLGALYGLWDPRGNDPMQPAAAASVVGGGMRPHFRTGRPISLSPRLHPLPLLDYLGVRYLLVRHRRTLPPPWEPVWDGEGGRIWKNPQALPLFFFPARLEAAAEPAAALRQTLAIGDFAATAMVEGRSGEQPGSSKLGSSTRGSATPSGPVAAGPVGGRPSGSPAGVSPPGAAPTPAAAGAGETLERDRRQVGQVRVRRVLPNGFELETESQTGGLVASSVSFAGGWKVAVDRQPAEPRRVNRGFLGFAVAAGRHQVTLTYRPAGWVWGVWLWALGLALVCATVLARWRQTPTPRRRAAALSRASAVLG
ncbi:MAG TPA: YfhO family protein [Thermoanaerobaculia bacterium]|nr:YfhO family protein [Thermoanaerobaculia bacterium]